MTRERDKQRQRVYDCERVVFQGGDHSVYCRRGWKSDPLRVPGGVHGCQKVIDAWVAYLRRTPCELQERVVVTDGRSRRRAAHVAGAAFPDGDYGHELRMPVWTRSYWMLAHELAHAICHENDVREFHGPEFTQVYLSLLAGLVGAGHSDRLRAEFNNRSVRVNRLQEVTTV